MRVDLHCHTEASPDCRIPIERVAARCRERGIAVQAITDHNEVWGARQVQALVAREGAGGLAIIVGEEVATREGEIIGLFLTERIEPGLSAEETVRRIHEQGGLVLLPHGFDPLKRRRLRPAARARIAGSLDIVEAFNPRVSRPRWNHVAGAWAHAHGILVSAGSDAHVLADIGSAWVEVPLRPIRGPDDLREALRGAEPAGRWTHPAVAYLHKAWHHWRTRRQK